jgi:hypothetical protein
MKKHDRKISILQGCQARDKLATHSVDANTEKYSEPNVDSFLFFGDSICTTRPQVFCPVPAVEEDISENDWFFAV